MQQLTKKILNTKITKATKGSQIFAMSFVLFARFVVKSDFPSTSSWLRRGDCHREDRRRSY